MITENQLLSAKILILDDNIANVLLLEKFLVKDGYRNVRFLTDSREVEKVYSDFRPDLLLLDIKMPHIDGFAVMDCIKQMEYESYIPVLVITAQQDVQTRLQALHKGAKDFISKPLDKTEVLTRIRNMLEVRLLHNQISNHNKLLKQQVEERTRQLKERIAELERTGKKLLSQQAQLRSLSSELITTKDEERKRISAHLHDHISQNLALSHIKLETLMERASSDDISNILKEIRELLEEADRFTRSLMSELCPKVPCQDDFEKELEWLTEQVYKKHGISSYFEDDKQLKPLEDEVRVFLFQAVRELLINIVKHAQAHNTKVSVRKSGKRVQIKVEDNGVGFDKSEVLNNERFGLFNLEKRLNHLGGRLEIISGPGRGTAVTLSIPLRIEQK